MSRELVEVQFHDQTLTAVMHEGEAYVAMKPICEHLGLDWEAQRQRIERDELLNSVACKLQATATDHKEYSMVAIPVKFLNGWLFGIKINMVKEEIRENLRPRLLEYQLECYEVLHNHFKRKTDFMITRQLACQDIELLRASGDTLSEAKKKVQEKYKQEEGYDIFKYLGGAQDQKYFLLSDMVTKPTKANISWLHRILIQYGYLELNTDSLSKHPEYIFTAEGKLHCCNPRDKQKLWKWDAHTRELIWRNLNDLGYGHLIAE